MNTSCFKAYDIRGRVPDELSDEMAYRIGCSYARIIKPKQVVVGRDIRLESPMLATALIRGLSDSGVGVIDIGLCGTEEVYFQTFHRQSAGVGGGIMITASHNPKGYNGMKLVREGAIPISNDSGLLDIRDNLMRPPLSKVAPGSITTDTDKSLYIEHLLSYIELQKLKPLKIIADPGNGMAGPVLRLLEKHLPFELILIQEAPDGEFPNGVPNPLLPEKRTATINAIHRHQADLGVAWDGDFDRCFFFDGSGRFIEGYYLVGLLAEVMLKQQPGAKIIHDPRLTWSTIEQVQHAGGVPVQSKTGHAFIKERMRQEDAIYGGEMSAHHYFRKFSYCDSGMIPWLLIAQLISQTGKSLAQLVNERMVAYPCSGEINYKVADAQLVLDRINARYGPQARHIDRTDGLSFEFDQWRFNLRSSNTEPLLRLNVETRANPQLLNDKVLEIQSIIQS